MKASLCYNTLVFLYIIEDLVSLIQTVCYLANILTTICVYNLVLQKNLCFSPFFSVNFINHRCFYLQFMLKISFSIHNKCLINKHLIFFFFCLLLRGKIMIALIKFKARMFCLQWIYYHYKCYLQRVKVSYPNPPSLMKLFCFLKLCLITNKGD